MCMSLPYGGNDKPRGPWQRVVQFFSFIGMLLGMLVLGLVEKLRRSR